MRHQTSETLPTKRRPSGDPLQVLYQELAHQRPDEMYPPRVRGWSARLARREQLVLPAWETNHPAQTLLPPALFTPAAAQLGRAHASSATNVERVSLSLCLKWKILVSWDLAPLTSLPSGKGFFHNANTLKSPTNGRMESAGCFGPRCQNSVAMKYS